MTTMDHDDGKTRSRLAKHLKLMGIEDHPGLSEQDLAGERAAMNAAQLPPLNFGTAPAKRPGLPPWMMYSGGAFAAAAAAIFLIMNRGVTDDPNQKVRIKGGPNVEVFYEEAGHAAKLEPGKLLGDGAKVSVRVVSPEKAFAYLAVTNAAGAVLSMSEPLPLEASVPVQFPGSLELTGANEGETLVVLVCAKQPTPAELQKAQGEGCKITTTKLR